MTNRRFPLWPILALIVIGASLRVARHIGWLPLPPNVSPVSALAFLAAAYLPRRWGWLVPIGLMVASDMAIGGYDWRIMATVYGAFGAAYGLGLFLRHRRSAVRIGLLTLTGSLAFFLLSNAAVWLWGGMYQPTVAGLLQSYTAGLPFFRNTILGDLGYTAIGFGLVELSMVYWRRHAAVKRMTVHG